MEYSNLVNFVILNVSCIKTKPVLLPDQVFHCIIAHSAMIHTVTDDTVMTVSVAACCRRQCDCHRSVL